MAQANDSRHVVTHKHDISSMFLFLWEGAGGEGEGGNGGYCWFCVCSVHVFWGGEGRAGGSQSLFLEGEGRNKEDGVCFLEEMDGYVLLRPSPT